VSEPHETRVALRTGLSYHVLEWGAEHAASDHTVLLLHGFLDFAWGWDEVARRLAAAGLHVVAPDLRGHGDSDRVGPGGYYYFMDYLADVAEVVRLTARRTLSICGHSMGGGVAAYYAGVFPERVARLALLEGVNAPERPMEPTRTAAWISGWMKVAERKPRPGYPSVVEAAERLRKNDPKLDLQLARWLAERGTRRRPDGTLEFKHDPLHVTVGPYGYTIEAAARFWRNIQCPTLLVDGAESAFRLAPEEEARRYGAFEHARHVVLPGAAHMMQRHQPAALAQVLVDFFRTP
jgi:pimeloyl-ACP methyl ester carboxylesterase